MLRVADHHLLGDAIGLQECRFAPFAGLLGEPAVHLHPVALRGAQRWPVPLRVVGDEEAADDADAMVVRVSPGGAHLLAPAVEHHPARALGQDVGGVAGGPRHAELAGRRDPQRRAARLHRGRRHRDVVELVALAVVAERLARPGQLQDVDALFGERHAARNRDAEGAELVRRIPEPGAQLHPAAGDLVEDGEVLGEADRMRERQQGDIGGDAHPLRHGGGGAGDGGEAREVTVLDEVVLAEPHEVEAELVEEGELLEGLGVDVLQRVRATGRAPEVVGDTEAERRRHARNIVLGRAAAPAAPMVTAAGDACDQRRTP